MAIVVAISAFIFGFMIALIIANIHRKPVGTLRIDRSDPDDAPYLFLEMAQDPRVLMQRRYVRLKVNTQNYISHK